MAMAVRKLPCTREEKLRLAQLLFERNRRKAENSLNYYQPYKYQKKFFKSGALFSQRLLMAGNRVGKTDCGAREMAYHLTGLYPDWWEGKRFDGPIRAWAGSDSAETTRDNQQSALFGDPEDPSLFGTGAVPKHLIGPTKPKTGIPNAFTTVLVKHVTGGWSALAFKSYDQRRKKWQGKKLDVVWLDEEPAQSIYAEAVTRTLDKTGITYLTFTPLMGLSDVVLRFVQPENGATGQDVTMATWDDAEHLDEKAKAELLATLPEHEKEARSKGVPSLGAGKIYTVSEASLKVDPFEIPDHWPRLFALDVGWNKTAVIWGARDRDSDIVYLYSEHYKGEEQPFYHASAIRSRGDWIPGVFDPAARGRKQDDGKRLSDMYKKELHGQSLHKAKNAVEAGLHEVHSRMKTGRLKVFSTLSNWWEEYRIYHRKEDGNIVKKNDHLMDATRYLVMEIKRALTKISALPPIEQLEPDADGIYF